MNPHLPDSYDRDAVLSLLEAWDPESEDLPDLVALAIDEDDAVRAAFDARFAPTDLSDIDDGLVSGGLADLAARVLPPPAQRTTRRRRVVWGTVGLLMAAGLAGVVLVGGLGTTLVLAPGVDEEPAPELEVASADPAGERRRKRKRYRDTGRASNRVNPQLVRLGYVSDNKNVDATRVARNQRWTGKTPQFVDADADGDGIVAMSDKPGVMPATGESWQDGTEVGSQLVKITSHKIEIREKVYFDANDAAVDQKAEPMLEAIAEVIKQNPNLGTVAIDGHTAAEGRARGNQVLGKKRADVVAGKLIALGVPADRITTRSFGETRPLSHEAAYNNRVEFSILPPDTPVEPPSTEDYTDYGINPFVRVTDDPKSTFSIDVDTASYAMSRRKLQQGYLPPRSAVRPEEFVNAIPYDYRPPTHEPFAVHTEAAPNPFDSKTTLLRIGVQGKKVAVDQRKAVHLTFLVDTSCSMTSDDKLGLAKTSLKLLTNELDDGDTIALVAYAGSAGLVLPPTPMSHKQDVIRALDRLQTGGSTAMGAGIDLAYRQAMATLHEGAVNRVVLLSDGDANVGQTSHEALVQSIRGYANQGITLTTVGFGEGNYKDTMMERLANDGDGNYFYIDSEKEARKVFVDRLTSTLQVIARDVKLQVEFDPATVESYRLLGYENRDIADVDFRNDRVDAGEVGAGHQVTAIYEIVPTGIAGRMARLHVRNKAPGPDAPAAERSFAIDTSVIKPHFGEADSDFRIAVAAAGFAEKLRGSPHAATYGELLSIARRAKRVEYAEDQELIELIEMAKSLSGG